MKKAKLNYRPVAKGACNDVAYVVPSGHVEAINNALEQKNEKNRIEQMTVSKDAAKFNCK